MFKANLPASRRVRTRAGRRGFTMAEVALALMILLMMSLMFAAVFPLAIRAAQFSNNYAQAVMLGQHKIDQLRAVGYSKLDYTNLGPTNLSVVDAQNSDGSLDFTTADNLVANGSVKGFFPPGSTGTIFIDDYHNSTPPPVGGSPGAGVSAVPAGSMKYVTITIRWQGAESAGGSYSVSALIAQMPH